MPPLVQLLQQPGARANEPARYARLGEAKGFRHRLGGGFVLPA